MCFELTWSSLRILETDDMSSNLPANLNDSHIIFRQTTYKTSSRWILHYLKSLFISQSIFSPSWQLWQKKILQEAFTNSSTAIKTRSQSIFFGGQVRLEVMRLGHGKQCEKYWKVRHICKRTKQTNFSYHKILNSPQSNAMCEDIFYHSFELSILSARSS